jgi:cytoskeletal protein CcmA (bactofilin family)
MFGSKSEEPTVIGRGAVIEGTVRIRGRVQVDGRVDGVLEVEGTLSVGPEGRISGEVTAEDIAVGGEIEGKVTARKHLHVVRTGKVRGEVRYDTLQIDRGAVLDGRTLHGDEAEAGKVAANKAASISDDDIELSPPSLPAKARPSQRPAPIAAT